MPPIVHGCMAKEKVLIWIVNICLTEASQGANSANPVYPAEKWRRHNSRIRTILGTADGGWTDTLRCRSNPRSGGDAHPEFRTLTANVFQGAGKPIPA